MCGPCNWSNCPSHVRTVEINQDVENTPIVTISLWEWNIEYGVITQPYINLTYCRSPQSGPPVGLSPDLTYHGAHEMRIPPMMNVKVGKCLPQCLWHFHVPFGGARRGTLMQYTWYASWHPSQSTMFFQSLGIPHCWHFFDAPRQ